MPCQANVTADGNFAYVKISHRCELVMPVGAAVMAPPPMLSVVLSCACGVENVPYRLVMGGDDVHLDLSMFLLMRKSAAAASVSPRMTLTRAISSGQVQWWRIMFMTRVLILGLSRVSPYIKTSKMTGLSGSCCLNRHRAQSIASLIWLVGTTLLAVENRKLSIPLTFGCQVQSPTLLSTAGQNTIHNVLVIHKDGGFVFKSRSGYTSHTYLPRYGNTRGEKMRSKHSSSEN